MAAKESSARPSVASLCHERSGNAPDQSHRPDGVLAPVLISARRCRHPDTRSPRQQGRLLTAGLSSRLAANSVVEVNDAVSEPALVQEREQDADVLGQCALAATNNDSARGTGVTRRPDPRRSLASSSAPPIVMSAPAEWDGPYGRGDASRQATEAIQPGRSVDASGLNAPRPVGPGLRCVWLIVVGWS